MNAIGQNTTCPTDEDLLALLGERLESGQEASLSSHIELCDDCQHRLETLIKPTPDNLFTQDEVERVRVGAALVSKQNRLTNAVPFVDYQREQIPGIQILSCLGQGGMGAVFEARQLEPVSRKVAVKFIRADRIDDELILRFQRERSLLASIEHPCIARMYEAGQLAQGDPYFVMEFVNGTPITTFCTETQSTLHQRLSLFLKICNAVQFLHTKQIIHRDLKPANILVTSIDGSIVPKLIDFGLAKLIQVPQNEQHDQTLQGQPIGTLRYMSPEQAGATSVDTRTDIYSLGVLLYELIAGNTPLSPMETKSSSLGDILQLIRTSDPQRLSHCIRSDSDDHHLLSMQTTREHLANETSHDLDWIAHMALQKDPAHRYPSVDALAQDIRNVIKDRPISARPPSAIYLAKKFYRRNRFFVWSTAILASVLLAGILGTTYGLVKARQATQEAERIASREADARREANRLRDQERDTRIASEERRLKIRRAARVLQAVFEGLNPEIVRTGSSSELRAELIERLRIAAEELLTTDVAEDTDVLVLKVSLVRALIALGESENAIPLLQNVIDESEKTDEIDTQDRLALLTTLGQAYRATGQSQHASRSFEQAKRIADRELSADDPTRLAMMHYLSLSQSDAGDPETSMATIERLIKNVDLTNADTKNLYFMALDQFAFLSSELGRIDESVITFKKVLRHWQSSLPGHHPFVIRSRSNLAIALDRQGKHELAVHQLREVLQVTTQQYPVFSEHVGNAKINLATTLANSGEKDEAKRLLESVVANQADTPTVFRARSELILLHKISDGESDDRVIEMEALIREMKKKLGENHPAVGRVESVIRELQQ